MLIDLSPLFGANQVEIDQQLDVKFHVFPPSGQERWLLETRFCAPWHLKTWPRANFRARLIHRVAWAMARVGMHLPSRVEPFSVMASSTYASLRNTFDHLGIFLGTPGPNRKFVVFAGRPGQSIFVKIPISPASAALVKNEARALETLSREPVLAGLIPTHAYVAGHLAIDDVETDGAHYAELPLSEVVRVCDLLESRTRFTRLLEALRADWEAAPGGVFADHDSVIRGLIDAARNAARRFLDSLPRDMLIECYLAHGDFTRWNVLRAADGSARVIDWELYGAKPFRFDLIHYYVSHDLLVSGKSPTKVLRHLDAVGKELGEGDRWLLAVGLYFASQALYYCSVYERQLTLHPQAIKQLQAWADILQRLYKHAFATLDVA